MKVDEYNQSEDEKLIERTPQEIQIREYKSAFYQLLAKPDSMTRVYNKNIIINIEDIYTLNDRINDKLKNHQEAGYIINVNVKYTNRKTLNFSNWQSFMEQKWYVSDTISNIVITWEFNAIFPNLTVPQRHTLMVKLSNRLKPEEMLNLVLTGKIEEIEELDNNFFPVLARVDFVDRVLGDELLNIVEDWVKGLKESTVQRSKTMLFLKRYKGFITTFTNYFTNIVFMICSVILTGRYILSLNFQSLSSVTSEQFVHIMYSIFICIFAEMGWRKFFGAFSDHLFERLKMYGESAVFNITNGDKNKQQKIISREKHNKTAIIGNLLLTIVINIVCGLIVNFWS